MLQALMMAAAVAGSSAGPTIALDLTWGSGDGQVTYRAHDQRGPDAVCVDDFGNFWILDGPAFRVHRFSPDGKLQATVKINTEAVDLAAAPSEAFFVLNWQDHRIHKFSPKGRFLTRFEFPREILFRQNVFALRRFHLAGDEIRIQLSSAEEYTLATEKAGWDAARIQKSRRDGWASRDGKRRHAFEASADGSWSLTTNGTRAPVVAGAPIRGIRFLDCDGRGGIWAVANLATGPGRTEDELWRLDASGRKLWAAKVTTGGVYSPFRAWEVDPAGIAYQIHGSAARWQLLAYRAPDGR